MWWTERGMVILHGAERRLFQRAFAELYFDIVELEDDGYQVETGVRVFDRLTTAQKFAVLDTVGRGLLRKNIKIKILTAALEAGVAAVYAQAQMNLHVEIVEPGHGVHWRSLIGDAYREGCEDRPPAKRSKDFERWESCVEALRDRILWDCDWDMEDDFLDKHPEVSAQLKDQFGVADDYYTDIPPDPKPPELARIHARLRRLCKA